MKIVLSAKKLLQRTFALAIIGLSTAGLSIAAITNPGFESNFDGWEDIDPSSISGVERSGTKSAKISGSGARVGQSVSVDSNSSYVLSAYVRGDGTVGVNVGGNNVTTNVSSGSSWQLAEVSFNTGSANSVEVFGAYNGGQGRFDDFNLEKISSEPPPPPSNAPCDNSVPLNAGQIEAESYCDQNGVRTQNTADTGGGENVGWIQNGDWTEYAIDVPAAGNYTFAARVASATSGGTISILSSGNNVGSIAVSNTGGWQSWQTNSTSVNLPAGRQNIRLNYGNGGSYLLNINWFSLTAETVDPPPPPPTNQAPTAAFTFTCTDLVCSFDGSGSSDSDGSIASYNWSFGNTGVTAINTFTSAGSYSVSLSVTDNDGESANTTRSVTVSAPPPPPAGCTGNSALAIQSASDNGTNDGNVPANTIDNNTTTRWSSNGIGKTISYDLGATATIRELSVHWYKSSSRNAFFEVQTSDNNSSWSTVLANGQSSIQSNAETYTLNNSDARYLRIVGGGNSSNSWNSILETGINGCFDGSAPPPPPPPPPTDGLDPSLPPSGNFDLLTWNISIPIDENNDDKADTIKEVPLSQGYTNSSYFYTGNDGGMVFRTPPVGPKTSSGTSYVRTELREMLRRGDTSMSTQGVGGNNWVFSSAPSADRNAAGGVDGTLRGTLAVNQVTSTGVSSQVGRVVFAQIHANDDEPIRLYYRKLPGNSKGVIYFAHEPRTGSEQWYEMIGSRSSSASDPADGIALNEVFSYEINVVGNTLTVTLIREGKPNIVETVDMSNSGYDQGGQYMYFKAGLYLQDNTANSNDLAQVTYYALENTHN